MPRPPKKIAPRILSNLSSRPNLRYALTKKGAKLHAKGEGIHESLVESLLTATSANGGQPVTFRIWKQFHGSAPIQNAELASLVRSQTIAVVARSRNAYAVG